MFILLTVKTALPPQDFYKDYLALSLSNRNLTIRIPLVNTTEDENTIQRLYDIYETLTADRVFQLVVRHDYDTVERNFTVIGEKIEKPGESFMSFNYFLGGILNRNSSNEPFIL